VYRKKREVCSFEKYVKRLSTVFICDVVCENLPFGGANNVFLDQLFFYKFVAMFMVEFALGTTKMSSVDVHQRQIS